MPTATAARPPFDPELDAVFALVRDLLPPLTSDTIPEFRALPANPVELTPDALRDAGVTRRDVTVPGYQGADMLVTVLARADHTGTGPGIYHVHGGGMITGDRLLGPLVMLPWVAQHDAVLVTAEYRLAPESPDPYPVEDCYAGLVWTADHAEELGIDPDRIMIAGASAGGGLAAGTALLARDRRGPKLMGQMLICPMLDDRDASVSTLQCDVGTWTRDHNRVGWDALLGEHRGTPDVSIYAAPARATDLSGLPPAYIDCGSAEVFRDEDVAYATALWRDGVQAELHVWAGGFHGFDMLASHTAVGQASIAARDSWAARMLGS
ncbi:Esterase/lipase [Nostocoides japonicum T1-X7]|uniref:Esterase/lipase n=1 Tax=Nostocoides japonicum T1-X7 TaxID=1194083 RepID=A0A077M0I9_9MICO|nr:alpha/beta hydrolase fold domain-containing protein [Tetrasphaera japonica]CCH77725.1 Esterase/lipase [Tetrasphaera japonica T1-X7]